MLIKSRLILLTIAVAVFQPGAAAADNIGKLVELFRIQDDVQAQYQECIDGSAILVESELRHELESGRLEIERGDKDWAILIAIYSEYYNSLCEYLDSEEIVNFYRAELRKRFSADEIEALIEFHQTPVGRKLSDEWFNINRVYGKILEQRQSVDTFEAQRRFEQRIDDFWDYRDENLNGDLGEKDA